MILLTRLVTASQGRLAYSSTLVPGASCVTGDAAWGDGDEHHRGHQGQLGAIVRYLGLDTWAGLNR